MTQLSTQAEFESLNKNQFILVSDGQPAPPKHHTKKHRLWTLNNYTGYFYGFEYSCGRYEIKIRSNPSSMLVNVYPANGTITFSLLNTEVA